MQPKTPFGMGGEGLSTIKHTRSIRNIALNQSVCTISLYKGAFHLSELAK